MEGATAMMKEASSSVCSRVASETKAPSSRGRGVKRSIHETNNTTMIIPVTTPSKRIRVEDYPSMSSAVAPLGFDDSWKTASVNDIVMTPEDHNVFCSNIVQVDALGASLVNCFDNDDDEYSCSTKADALPKRPPGEHTRHSAVDLTEDEAPKKWKKDPNADDDEEEDDGAQQQHRDLVLAREMQKQLDAEGMTATKTGRAWNFVSKVVQMHETLLGANRERQQQQIGREQVSTVATDDMVWLVERMLECQEEFLLAGKPVEVDIGYHYTRATNMRNICRDGLLTKAERNERNVRADRHRGSLFGDGIYTGNNPFAFRSFGDVLLLVARMKGSVQSGQEYRKAIWKRRQEERAADAPMHNHGILGAIKEDTAVLAADTVEALDGGPGRGMIVLRKSCQCVALVQFDSSVVQTDADYAPGNSLVHLYHEKLQGILDEFFNGGQKTAVHRVRASEMFATWSGRGPFAPIIPSRRVRPPWPRPLPPGFVVPPPGTAQSAPPTLRVAAAAVVNNNSPPPGPKPAPPGGDHRSSAAAGAAMSSSRAAEMKKYKEKFLILVRVLLKYLEQKDPPLCVKVKCIIKDCAERNKRQERGYESVTASMRARLKEVVNETYWKRAEAYLHHFLTQKAKTGKSLTSIVTGGSAQHLPPVLPSLSDPRTVSLSTVPVASAPRGYVSTTYPGRAARASSNVQQDDESALSYTAPNSLESADPAKAFCAVEDLHSIPKAECSVCLDPLQGDNNPVIALSGCGHHFHRACIENVLRHAKRCPICRKSIGEPVGKMPSGRMTVKRIARSCRGFDDGAGSIEISYSMQGGTQQPYHENPGVPYAGTNRKAYLPDNADGRKLLKRLRYAFSHGLTFTVGTSLSTRRPNSIVWSSIHHKTTLCGGGQHGFPDPGYFLNTNEDLDALGVPAADDCDQ